ncbi:MAG: S-methyl-5-thioribose-1-phosphate isomerase [bacterium]
MKINNKHYKTIWYEANTCFILNQTLLPFRLEIIESTSWEVTKDAIIKMEIRGAGAIGAAGAIAMAQAAISAKPEQYQKYIDSAKQQILLTRPTAQNLFDCVEKVYQSAQISPIAALEKALEIIEKIEGDALKIAKIGSELIRDGDTILTHCNAGWLAFVDWGSALAPVYYAAREGKKVFVYVDETRPRLQGSRLTAFELAQENIPHTVICDSASASLMAENKVNLVITGADRIAANGDTANKIGTLEKAICAKYFDIPFYIAANLSTFDFNCLSGKDIPIEYRSENEINFIDGIWNGTYISDVLISANSPSINPAFDITTNKLIKGIITEKGIFDASALKLKVLNIQ